MKQIVIELGRSKEIQRVIPSHVDGQHWTIHTNPRQCGVTTCGACFDTAGNRFCAACHAKYREEPA